MNHRIIRSLTGIAAVGLIVSLASPLLAQSNMGTWVANIAKSTYSPDPAPKSSTLILSGFLAIKAGTRENANAREYNPRLSTVCS